MAGDNIEDDGSKAKIQILQQRFGERSGPGFVGGKRSQKSHCIRAFGHVAGSLSCSRHKLFRRPADNYQPFPQASHGDCGGHQGERDKNGLYDSYMGRGGNDVTELRQVGQ